MNDSRVDTERAAAVLRGNDLGGYTVPTRGLYPYQWSWDSAITALGWLEFDEPRAWREVETMLRGQWPNGMLPHILFHEVVESYFPGPDVWGNRSPVPSSAISQPPVWATVVRLLHERARDRELAAAALERCLPGLVAYHMWWYRERDPDGSGLVCSFHPWESGMDNSPAWDRPLAAVPPVDWDYIRRDLSLVAPEQRPHKKEYDRYLYLVDLYRRCGFDSARIYRECPYRVQDVGIIAILHRATEDLVALCEHCGRDDDARRLEACAALTTGAIEQLWSGHRGCYLSRDLLTGEPLDAVTTATVLPLFAGLPSASRAAAMGALISDWLARTRCGLSSTHPDDAGYEPKRYWRGPVWLHINWMIALGLERYGDTALAADLADTSLRCLQGGFWEYYDAESGEGCGGDDFSWTAAVALHWLQHCPT